jgi:hypothetical protein
MRGGTILRKAVKETDDYIFETNMMKGVLSPRGEQHGITHLSARKNNKEIVREDLFILNFFRALGIGRPLSVLREGITGHQINSGIRVFSEPTSEHPVSIIGQYRVIESDKIDLEITATAKEPILGYEVFISSYFAYESNPAYYPRRPYSEREAYWISPVSANLYRGAYLAFPRDSRCAARIMDGRFQSAELVICPKFAAPMAAMRDPETKIGVLLMAEPERCTAVYGTYAPNGAFDNITSHNAIYFSLFGEDLKTGEVVSARLRAVVCELDDAMHGSDELFDDFVGTLA